MSKLEVNKCYALVTSNNVSEVIKTFPSDNANFANFFKTESISLRSYELGILQTSYIHRDVTRDYVEISEEDYQKFYHLWEVYCKSLKILGLKLEQKVSI